MIILSTRASLTRFLQVLAVLTICLVVLSGCSKSTPIKLPSKHHDLYGTWQNLNTKDNGLTIDNILLVFHQDDTISYVTCHKKVGYSSSKLLPEFNLIRFKGKHFDIQSTIGFIVWTEHLVVDRFPYHEHGQTYIQVNGDTLRKLLANEHTDYQKWPCFKDKDQ